MIILNINNRVSDSVSRKNIVILLDFKVGSYIFVVGPSGSTLQTS